MSSNYRILYASEDKVSVYAEQSGIAWGNGDPVLITLTRADSNPNKGKKILELAYVDWPSFGLCEAVNSYNRNSDDRYVRLVNKYHSFDRDVTESVDILMEDIRSESGPDMVILNSDHAVLDDDRYLVDVSGLCGMDSPYYRVPYGICYRGLVVKTSLLDDPDQKGITYEQYDELVKSANNGLNVLGVEKKDVFNRLFKNKSSYRSILFVNIFYEALEAPKVKIFCSHQSFSFLYILLLHCKNDDIYVKIFNNYRKYRSH